MNFRLLQKALCHPHALTMLCTGTPLFAAISTGLSGQCKAVGERKPELERRGQENEKTWGESQQPQGDVNTHRVSSYDRYGISGAIPDGRQQDSITKQVECGFRMVN